MSFEVDIVMRVGDRQIALQFASKARLTALVGPSGVGKTSVLNAIAGLLKPDMGQIVAGGETLFDAAHAINLPPERRRAGYVFQGARLFPHRKVAANLAYGAKLVAEGGAWITWDEVTELLEIGDLLGRWPATLSGGESRRVAIGRALLAAPRFLLLDEPFASLDKDRAERLASLIERIRDTLDIPILLVSHTAADVQRLADQTIEMQA